MGIRRKVLIGIGIIAILSLFFTPLAAGDEDRSQNQLYPETATTTSDDANATETVIVRFSDGMMNIDASSTDELQSSAKYSQESFTVAAEESPYVDIQRSFWIANAMVVEYDSSVLSEDDLMNVRNVETVHENFDVSVNSKEKSTAMTNGTSSIQSTESDTTYGLDMIRAPETWDNYDTRGEGVGIAVLDTGIDPKHEAIDVGKWAEFDVYGNMIEGSDPYDYDGHGTHVAGTVAGDAIDGKEIGVAPEADIHGAKVLNEDGGSFAQVLAGIEWATENDDDIDIIQMSLGTTGFEDYLIEPVENARDVGQIVSAAAGNTGEGSSSTPGNMYSTISAGAVGDSADIMSFSSSEKIDTADAWDDPPEEWPDEYTVPDVSAPGHFVESAKKGTTDDLESMSGTSMASPHVTGSAALILSALDDDKTPSQVEGVLRDTADHPEDSSTSSIRYGSGVIDSFAAVTKASEEAVVTGTVADEDGKPVSGVTVKSSKGTTTNTDSSGEYQLLTSQGEQDITASGFGWESKTATVNVGDGEEVTESFKLQETVDADVDNPAESHIAPGETYDVSFDLANVDTYSFAVDSASGDGSSISPELFTVKHEKGIINHDDKIDVSSDERIEISITVDQEAFGTATFHHNFEGKDSTVTVKSRTTHIHPEPVNVPQDINPDQLQPVIDVLQSGTTVSLDSDNNFEEVVTDDNPTAIHIDRPLTITGKDGMASIDISGSADVETTGIDVKGVDAHVESVDINGDVDTGIAIGGSDATVSGISVSGTKTGTVITAGDSLTDATYDSVDTGVVVETGLEEVTGIDATASDAGVVVKGAVGDVEDIDLSLSGTGNGVVVDSGSIEDINDISVSNGKGGLELTSISDLTVDNADFDGLDTGISIADSSSITVSDTSITDSETTIRIADGTTTTTVKESQFATGEITFGNVPVESNTVNIEYGGRNVSVSATNTTVVDTDKPEQLDTHGAIGAFYDLTAHTNDAVTDITTGYDAPNETIPISESSLQFHRFDSENWSSVSSSTVDTEQETVSSTIDEYSVIGVYGEKVPYVGIEETIAVDEIQPGDRIDVLVQVENKGLASGVDTVEYEFNGDIVDDENITLDPSESKSMSLKHETPSDLNEGEYEYTISTANETLSETVTVNSDADSPNITTDLSFDTEINTGESLSVTVELENTGEGDGTSERTLSIGGTTLVDDLIYLNASETSSESFDISLDEPGEYEIVLNNESFGAVDVSDPNEEEEENDSIPGFNFVSIFAALSIILALAVRRYANSD